MAVKARFSDLSPREAAVWAPALVDGDLTFGRRHDVDESGELNLRIPQGTFAALAAFEAARPHADSATLALKELHDLLFEPHYGEQWMSLDSFGELIASGEVTFWPGALPDPYVDFPSPANVVVLGGPESGAERPTDLMRPIIARAVRARLRQAITEPAWSHTERDDQT